MITYLPTLVLKRVAKKKAIQNLVTAELTLNKAAVKTLANSDLLSQKKITEIALRVINGYKKKYKDTKNLSETLNDKKKMVQEVENAAIFEISKDIKTSYRGEFYIWLPSDAEKPDPLHQLNYGQKFQVGKGEMPGDRYGCRCGMQILVDETRLDLE